MAILTPLITEWRPCAIPPALAETLTTALVRALRKFLTTPPGFKGCCICALESPLLCLRECLRVDKGNTIGLGKRAINAGIVTVFIDLLTRDHEWTIVLAVETSELLLVRAPKGEIGLWGVELLRAIAQLLGATSRFARLRNKLMEHHGPLAQTAPHAAAVMLYNVGSVHPELFRESHTWGFEKGVRRLTKHNDPDTAAAAWKLKDLFFPQKVPDVSSSPQLCPGHVSLLFTFYE